MPILTIYCDDSGTASENRVAVVAGYVGQDVQWERFQKEWKAVLKGFGVQQMHRADLEALQGEFKKTRDWNKTRRREFLQELYPIIRKRTKIPIGSAVIKEDFEAIIPEHLKAMFGGVYGWCVHECIVAVGKWCAQRQYRHPIQWVFEAGTKGQGQVSIIFENLAVHEKCHIRSLEFCGKNVVPLQSADVLAYEVFKQVENQIVDRGEKHPVRISMQHLIHATDHRYLKYWNKQRLTEWLGVWKQKINKN